MVTTTTATAAIGSLTWAAATARYCTTTAISAAAAGTFEMPREDRWGHPKRGSMMIVVLVWVG